MRISRNTLFLIALLALPTQSATIYVALDGNGTSGESWETAFTSISSGITVSQSGDTIWIKSGRYNEAIQLKSHVSLLGGFSGIEAPDDFHLRDTEANETIIDATGFDTSTLTATNVTDATLDGFVITGGFALEGGGAHISSSTVSFARCIFTRNQAEDGGGLYTTQKSMVSICDCEVNDNRGYINAGIRIGGGIWCENANLRMERTIIRNHTFIRANGGGLVLFTGAEAIIRHSTITHNHVGGSGGGIYCGPSALLSIQDSLVSDNRAGSGGVSNGGGLELSDRCSVIGCTISDNSCGEDGGGIYIGGKDNLVQDCLFLNNSSDDGGGMYAESSGAIESCEFIGNHAEVFGGGVATRHSGMAIQNCLFSENSCGDKGGGLWMDGGLLERSIIKSCTAVRTGGGIYLWRRDNRIRNCLITGNFCEQTGGGLSFFNWRDSSIINCTIVGNHSSTAAGIFNDGSDDLRLVNTILRNSATSEIVQIIDAETTSNLIADHSNILGGWPGNGNIDEDPLFVDSGNDDYHLLMSSPCIDSGTTVDVFDDLDGNPRPKDVPGIGINGEGAFDMGAYEFQSAYRNSLTDINRDGVVDAKDLLILQGDWGKVPGP